MRAYRVVFQRRNWKKGTIHIRVDPTVFYVANEWDIETVKIMVALAGCDKGTIVPLDQLGPEYQVTPTRSAS